MMGTTRSPLLDLPRDIKWLVFDVFLLTYTIRPTDMDIYALPHQWPEQPDLSIYLALVATCKELRDEVTSYFEERCLPKMTFYFDSLPSLFGFYSVVKTSKPDYLKIRFSLRNRCAMLTPPCLSWSNGATLDFMYHTMSNFDHGDLYENRPHDNMPKAEGWHDWSSVSSGVWIHVHRRGNIIIDTVLAPEDDGLKLTSREIRGPGAPSMYWEMTGILDRLDWSKYDDDMVGRRYLDVLSNSAEEFESTPGWSYQNCMEVLVKELHEFNEFRNGKLTGSAAEMS